MLQGSASLAANDEASLNFLVCSFGFQLWGCVLTVDFSVRLRSSANLVVSLLDLKMVIKSESGV